jgi:hypothetical protein
MENIKNWAPTLEYLTRVVVIETSNRYLKQKVDLVLWL